jgi:hypothetical protein
LQISSRPEATQEELKINNRKPPTKKLGKMKCKLLSHTMSHRIQEKKKTSYLFSDIIFGRNFLKIQKLIFDNSENIPTDLFNSRTTNDFFFFNFSDKPATVFF